MKTLLCVGLLVVAGIAANFLAVIVLNLAGFPGAVFAGKPGARSRARFVVGSLISAAGQSYVYLAFVALVVNWTRLASARPDVSDWLLWPCAFCVVIIPIYLSLLRGRIEAQEFAFANPQVEALHITTIASFLSFGLFIVFPDLVRLGWNWVPYSA